MRSLFMLSLFVIGTTGMAQITIGPADMPSAGDTVRFQNTAAQGIDPTGTEANYIWDMGMLTPDAEGADTCVTVGSTPLLYQFYFNNNILYAQWAANYAVRGQSFDFQSQLTVTDVYDYYKKDATGFRNVGFGANINGIPASVRRMPVDFVHVFPMNYGDMDTSYSEFSLDIPTLGSYTQQQTRYNEVDGWGTLYLPADTFEVLRVKSTLVRADSIYIEQFGTGFAFDEPEAIEYKWIAQGMDEPVLQVNSVGGNVTTARFYYHPDDITTGVVASNTKSAFSAFPNPAADVITFTLPADGGVLLLRDAQGREVLSRKVAAGTAQVSESILGLAPGCYSAALNGVDVQTIRVMVQR